MMTDIYIYDDKTNGATVKTAEVELVGRMVNFRFMGIHLAIRKEDLKELIGEEDDGDDRR